MKKARNPFTPKKFFHAKKKEFNNKFDSKKLNAFTMGTNVTWQESAIKRERMKESFMLLPR